MATALLKQIICQEIQIAGCEQSNCYYPKQEKIRVIPSFLLGKMLEIILSTKFYPHSAKIRISRSFL